MVRWSMLFGLVVAGLTFLLPEKAVAQEMCPCGCGMLLSACNPAKCSIKAAMLQKQAAAEAQAKAEARARAEAKARAQAEAQARAQAEERARQQAEAEARAQAEAQKAQAEAQAKAQAQAQAKPDPQAGRLGLSADATKNQAEAQAKAQRQQQAVATAADTLVQSVADRKSSGDCARFVQRAIEGSGIPIGRGNAEDFGGENGLLRQANYQEATGEYKKGDVVVIDPIPGHPHGHVAMYDGSKWVSDFAQQDINPYRAPPGASERPSITYKVYRYQPGN